MIRKPDARDFRESGTVTVIREAGTVAVEGARGMGEGTRKFFLRAFGLLMLFGFVMTGLTAMGALGGLIVIVGVVAYIIWRLQRRNARSAQDRFARWGEPAAPKVRPVDLATVGPTRIELSISATARTAAMFAVPALLMMPFRTVLPFAGPTLLFCILALALGLLIFTRVFGDRTVVAYDGETLTVTGMLGEASILWADVANVVIRTTSFYDVKRFFISGARTNLVILGRFNRLGGPDTLYVPLDLLGLDRAGTAALVTRFLDMRGVIGAEAPVAVAPLGVPVAARVPEPSVADLPFDADEIMRRYLAERAQLVATQRPDLVPAGARRTFGRKTA